MTDRYNTLTVALEKPIRDDDAEPLIDAIRMMKGVANVTGHVNSIEVYTAKEQLRIEWAKKFSALLSELFDGRSND